jgi:hypothetical protein
LPEPLLTFFKYLFLALLYLFFLRVLRAVWIELREPKVATGAGVGADALHAADPTLATAAVPIYANGAVAHLVAVDANGEAMARWPLNGEATLGRSPGCAICLPEDTYVSQIHGRVFCRDGAVWVEDLGSTNGTYVNEQAVTAATRLAPGDRIRLGRTVLELQG